MALSVLPDVEKLTVAYLQGVPEVAAIVGSRVHSAVPASPTYPLVVVRRFGGFDADEAVLDAARVQVDCYGGTKGQAQLLAQTVRAALHRMPTAAHAGAYVTGVAPGVAPTWSPQGDNNQPMYLLDATVYAQPEGN